VLFSIPSTVVATLVYLALNAIGIGTSAKLAAVTIAVFPAVLMIVSFTLEVASSFMANKKTKNGLTGRTYHRLRGRDGHQSKAASVEVVAKLRSIARAFRELQLQRHLADYSNATKWDRIKASAKVNQAKTAFSDWKLIRNEYVAQPYLVSLLSNYKEE
jgi:ketol-acid reductoisomerase